MRITRVIADAGLAAATFATAVFRPARGLRFFLAGAFSTRAIEVLFFATCFFLPAFFVACFLFAGVFRDVTFFLAIFFFAVFFLDFFTTAFLLGGVFFLAVFLGTFFLGAFRAGAFFFTVFVRVAFFFAAARELAFFAEDFFVAFATAVTSREPWLIVKLPYSGRHSLDLQLKFRKPGRNINHFHW